MNTATALKRDRLCPQGSASGAAVEMVQAPRRPRRKDAVLSPPKPSGAWLKTVFQVTLE